MFCIQNISLTYIYSWLQKMNLNHLFLFRPWPTLAALAWAAERIHVSQPAISMQVGELEAQLGLTLFHRLPRGVKVTMAGQLLLGYAQRLSALADEAERAMAEVKGLCRGRLAVAAREHKRLGPKASPGRS
jgi:DNA-binding transcriptional LysR family regulator